MKVNEELRGLISAVGRIDAQASDTFAADEPKNARGIARLEPGCQRRELLGKRCIGVGLACSMLRSAFQGADQERSVGAPAQTKGTRALARVARVADFQGIKRARAELGDNVVEIEHGRLRAKAPVVDLRW